MLFKENVKKNTYKYLLLNININLDPPMHFDIDI